MNKEEFRKLLIEGLTNARRADLDRMIDKRIEEGFGDEGLIDLYSVNVSCMKCKLYDQCEVLSDSTANHCRRFLEKKLKEIKA